MIGIVTAQFETMKTFYKEVMAMEVLIEMDEFVEFKQEGIRFAISTHEVMYKATGAPGFLKDCKGHSFELAFRVNTPEEVDKTYKELIEKRAKAVAEPADMPWNQRTAFFADPDGNVHEVFTDLPKQL